VILGLAWVRSGDKPAVVQVETKTNQVGIYLQPEDVSANNGEEFVINIIENSNEEPVNAVEARLSFDPTLLQYVSVENSKDFEIVAGTKNDNGVITVSRATVTKKSGNKLVASLKFKPIKSGQAEIKTDGSIIASATSHSDISKYFGLSKVTIK